MFRQILRTSFLKISDLVIGGSKFEVLKEIRGILDLDKLQIRKVQLKKLKRLLIHAYETVPFYKSRFDDAGFNPYEFNELRDMDMIPILSRDDLQNNFESLKSSKIKEYNAKLVASGGSTGVPVRLLASQYSRDYGSMIAETGQRLSGWKPGKRTLKIWGNPINVARSKTFKQKIKNYLYNETLFPAYSLSDIKSFSELYGLLKSKRFFCVTGYTNAIYYLCVFMRDNNLKIGYRIQYVFTTAENLQSYQRDLIEKYLGPVYDCYGSTEILGLGYECPVCGNYHVMDTHVFLDYKDSTQEYKHAIITDLDNFSMPLIKYQIGDLIIPTTEKCARYPLSSFESVLGRSSDVLQLKNGGRLVIPSFFGSKLIKDFQTISAYQVERVSEDLLIVRLATSSTLSTNDINLINENLKAQLEGYIEWQLEVVTKIKVSKNGKHKILIDRVKV